jgi:hypothetical protein
MMFTALLDGPSGSRTRIHRARTHLTEEGIRPQAPRQTPHVVVHVEEGYGLSQSLLTADALLYVRCTVGARCAVTSQKASHNAFVEWDESVEVRWGVCGRRQPPLL